MEKMIMINAKLCCIDGMRMFVLALEEALTAIDSN